MGKQFDCMVNFQFRKTIESVLPRRCRQIYKTSYNNFIQINFNSYI